MKTVINYSHALSPAAADELSRMIGPFTIKRVKCDIVFSKPALPQLEALALAGMEPIPTHIIPPAASIAAAYVTNELVARLADQGLPLDLIVITRKPDWSFAPSEIIPLSV